MDPRKAFLLRISTTLWRELEAWAQEDLRSVNGQIEFLLRQAILKRRGLTRDAEAPEPAGSTLPVPAPGAASKSTAPPPPPPPAQDEPSLGSLELDRQD